MTTCFSKRKENLTKRDYRAEWFREQDNQSEKRNYHSNYRRESQNTSIFARNTQTNSYNPIYFDYRRNYNSNYTPENNIESPQAFKFNRKEQIYKRNVKITDCSDNKTYFDPYGSAKNQSYTSRLPLNQYNRHRVGNFYEYELFYRQANKNNYQKEFDRSYSYHATSKKMANEIHEFLCSNVEQFFQSRNHTSIEIASKHDNNSINIKLQQVARDHLFDRNSMGLNDKQNQHRDCLDESDNFTIIKESESFLSKRLQSTELPAISLSQTNASVINLQPRNCNFSFEPSSMNQDLKTSYEEQNLEASQEEVTDLSLNPLTRSKNINSTRTIDNFAKANTEMCQSPNECISGEKAQHMQIPKCNTQGLDQLDTQSHHYSQNENLEKIIESHKIDTKNFKILDNDKYSKHTEMNTNQHINFERLNENTDYNQDSRSDEYSRDLLEKNLSDCRYFRRSQAVISNFSGTEQTNIENTISNTDNVTDRTDISQKRLKSDQDQNRIYCYSIKTNYEQSKNETQAHQEDQNDSMNQNIQENTICETKMNVAQNIKPDLQKPETNQAQSPVKNQHFYTAEHIMKKRKIKNERTIDSILSDGESVTTSKREKHVSEVDKQTEQSSKETKSRSERDTLSTMDDHFRKSMNDLSYRDSCNEIKNCEVVGDVDFIVPFNEVSQTFKKKNKNYEVAKHIMAENETMNALEFNISHLFISQSKIHGNGLFSLSKIKKGQCILEYQGQIVGDCMANKLEKEYKERGIRSIYFFRVNKDRIIDATVYGNMARFVNHSCNPNAEAQMYNSSIYIFALKDIEPSVEITMHYNFSDGDQIECQCESENCVGAL